MGPAGDAIPSQPGRQVTAQDSAEREKREAEKNATKASLNLQATAGNAAAVPTGSKHLPIAALTSARALCLFSCTKADVTGF